MSVACSGKSTFAGQHAYYHGYKIVDFAELLPTVKGVARFVLYLARVMPRLRRLVKNNQTVVERTPEQYYKKIFSYLRDQKEPTAVLARRAPEDLEAYADIAFAAVLIPLECHQRNCWIRRRQLRNPLPFFRHWTTDIQKIEVMREQLEHYARRHGIPVYESFAGAIEQLSRHLDEARTQ